MFTRNSLTHPLTPFKDFGYWVVSFFISQLFCFFSGTIARMVKRVVNADIPYVPWLTGYFAILIGAVMTVIVQSSSIFTSTLTPLIGK